MKRGEFFREIVDLMGYNAPHYIYPFDFYYHFFIGISRNTKIYIEFKNGKATAKFLGDIQSPIIEIEDIMMVIDEEDKVSLEILLDRHQNWKLRSREPIPPQTVKKINTYLKMDRTWDQDLGIVKL